MPEKPLVALNTELPPMLRGEEVEIEKTSSRGNGYVVGYVLGMLSMHVGG